MWLPLYFKTCYFLSLSFPVCVFLSYQNNMLFTNHGGWCVWFISSISFCFSIYLCFSLLQYTPVGFFLTFHFLCNFDPLCCLVYWVFLCMRYCFLVYTGILVPVRSFLVSGVDRLLLHTGLLMVRFISHFISLSKYQTPPCCPCIQLVGHFLQSSGCHSMISWLPAKQKKHMKTGQTYIYILS